MRRSKFRRPQTILIFNGARVLIAIVRSLNSAAELTHTLPASIHNCCIGKTSGQECIITDSSIRIS